MVKRIFHIFVLAALAICLLPVTGEKEARALDNGTADINYTSSVEAEFPLTLTFRLSAESDSKIDDIRLHYSTNRIGFAPVTSEVYLQITPAAAIDTQWSWDMRKTGGLPPGTVIEYWWTLEDTGGNSLETLPDTIRFDDERYDWKVLTEGNLTLYWYDGNTAFAEELMDSAQQALVILKENTGAALEKPTSIYIYGNSSDLLGAMVFPQEWTGGVAYTLYNTIAIGIGPFNIEWGKEAMTHELTHLVIHQMVLNPYSDLPTWLDEGLAMYTQGPLDSSFINYLENAAKDNSLITVRSLSSPFSTDTQKAYLSYAQSYSIAEYLITEYGQGKMLELLTVFSEGSGYDQALNEVYGFDMDELNTLWKKYVAALYGIPEAKTATAIQAEETPEYILLSAPIPVFPSFAWR